MQYNTHTGSAGAGSVEQKMDFVVGIANMTVPGFAAVESGFANLTAAGMRTSGALNAAMSTTQAAVMAMGGASALALGMMTAEAMKFQREMAMVKGLLENISDTDFAKLTDAAKRMSVTFGEAPADIAKGFQALARAGVEDVNDQINLMTSGIRLAKVEGIGIEESNKVLITMKNLWQDSYDNVERYANALAHAANISTTTVPQLRTALSYFGGAAAENWTPEESLSAISAMASKGVEGSMAGTALRSFSSFLIRDTPKSEKALKKLGLSVNDLWESTPTGAREKLKPLEDIILMMTQASISRGMGRGDLAKVLSEFASPRMVQQYIKLFPTQKELEEGTWQFANFNKRMKETYDIGERFNMILGTTQEKLKQTVASIRILAINVGEKMLPAFSFALDIFKGFINALANSQVAVTGLALGLSALAVAGAVVVGKWGWDLVAKAWTDATNIFSKGISGLIDVLRSESVIVDKNTASYVANAAARNLAAGGVGPYPMRDVEGWAQARAEGLTGKYGAGKMGKGAGFYGNRALDLEDVFFGSMMAEDIGRAYKGGGWRGMNAPMPARTWEAYARDVLGLKGVEGGINTLKGIPPEQGLARQKFILEELATQHGKNQRAYMSATSKLRTLEYGGATAEEITKAKSRLTSSKAEMLATAAVMADYNNIIGGKGERAGLRAILGGYGTKAKGFLGKWGTVGGALASKGIFAEQVAGVAAGTPFSATLSTLPGIISSLPVLGVVAGVAARAIVVLALTFKHLGDQIEENTKKAKKFTQEATKLESKANKLQGELDKSKPGAPGYFEKLQDLHKTNDELDAMYRKIATVNREVYNAKAWQPWNWAEWRSDKGPSWYGTLGTSMVGTLSPSKWKSGENLTKMLGLEPSFGATWMSGPQEQMFSEAYKVEKKRQTAIATLNNAHNGQMASIEEQYKKGRFKNEDEYLKARNSQIERYNNKRKTLDTQYDRQTSKIVGPQNVDATRRMYQMEERLTTARLQAINAVMKMMSVVFQLITLPLTIFGGGAFKASTDSVSDRTENLSSQINKMAKQMESAAQRIENFAKAINNIANPIMYTIYVISHFVAYMKGIISWAINPVNWLTKKPPNPIPESYGTWLDKNAKGEDHYNPGELEDSALQKGYDWVRSGQAGQDIEAGIKDIPNKIRGGVRGTKEKITGTYRSIVGAPHRLWNSIFGPRTKKTPEERRIEEEARKAGKKPGEYYPAAEGQSKETAQEESDKKKMQFGLHSPFVATINSGTSGALDMAAGVSTLVFPDLDPKRFKETAKGTAAELFNTFTGGNVTSSNIDMSGAYSAAKDTINKAKNSKEANSVENLLKQMNKTLDKIAENTSSGTGTGADGKGFRDKAKEKWKEKKEQAGEKAKDYWQKAKDKTFEGIYGEETPSGQTYMGKDIPKREGGILGEGGMKDKLRTMWEDTDNKRRAGLEKKLFGEDMGIDLKTGNLRKKGGVFGREGIVENLLGEENQASYRDILGKAEGAIFGKNGEGGIAGALGREGQGDWAPLSEVFGEEGYGGQIFGKVKPIYNNVMNTLSKVGGKGVTSIFQEGGILSNILGKGGILGGLAGEGGILSGVLGGIGGLAGEGGILAGLLGEGGLLAGLTGVEGGLLAFGLADIWNPLGWAALGISGALAAAELLKSTFGFKKHSPFTVWKGQAGTMPGAMPGSGDAFSIRFPELDSEKMAKKVTDAGASVAASSSSGGIVIENLIVQRASEDAEEIQKTIKTGLVDLARELGV